LTAVNLVPRDFSLAWGRGGKRPRFYRSKFSHLDRLYFAVKKVFPKIFVEMKKTDEKNKVKRTRKLTQI